MNLFHSSKKSPVQILVERCKKITELNLRATFINKISVDYISENLSELEKLDISENELEDQDFLPLRQLPKLRTLVVEDEKYGVTKEKVQNLGKMIPQLKKIIQLPQYSFRSMGIAKAYKTYDLLDGFW